jgi:hypothetical protein
MEKLKNLLGVVFLTLGYMATAWLISKLSGIDADRALLITIVTVVAQVRWFQRDESPL